MASVIDKGNDKYMVRVFLGRDEKGKVKFHNKTIKGKREAQAYLAKMTNQKNEGIISDSGRVTVKEHMETWLESVVKNRVRVKTYLDYKDLTRLNITPIIGNIRLDKLKPEQIQILYNDMLKRNLSPRTVRYTHTILNNSLKQAVKWNRIYRNPAELVDLPRQEKKEMTALSPEQTKVFMEAITYSPWKAIFSLLIDSGMRPGEALGLKWDDVDFENSRVTINRSLTRIPKNSDPELYLLKIILNIGNWIIQEPKTKRSRRTIPLTKHIINDLREHQIKQKQQKLKAKPGTYTDQSFIFAANNGEPMSEQNIYNRHFKPILKYARLPSIRLYDLRHSCATLLLSAGENPKVVSERLGHASIVLTLDTYSHVLPDMQKSATDKMEDLLSNGTIGKR